MTLMIRNLLQQIKSSLLQSADHARFWILLAVFFKTVLLTFHLSQAGPNDVPGFIGYVGGDTPGYLDPIESLILKGSYEPDYRMPGYSAIYLPLRLFFSKGTACNLILIIQTFIASVSVYFLALTARISFNSEKLFYLVFYFFAISSYTSLFDDYLLTESLCTSFTIFTTYLFCKFYKSQNIRFLFFSGFFMAWTIFLRPVYAPLLLLFSVIIVFNGLARHSIKKIIAKSVFVFLLSFVILDSCWIIRNYYVHKKVIVLARSVYYPVPEDTYLIELIEFVRSWGGDRTWWNPNAEIRWFGIREARGKGMIVLENKNIQLPSYIFTSKFSIDSLAAIKDYIYTIDLVTTPDSLREHYTKIVKDKLVLYTESIRDEKPFLFYVKSPAILFWKFFAHSGTYNLFNKPFSSLTPFMILVKIFYSGLYLFTIVMGFCGLVWTTIKSRYNPLALLLVSIPFYSMLFYPVIFKQVEYRYFVPAFPFVIILASNFLMEIFRRVKMNFGQGIND